MQEVSQDFEIGRNEFYINPPLYFPLNNTLSYIIIITVII